MVPECEGVHEACTCGGTGCPHTCIRQGIYTIEAAETTSVVVESPVPEYRNRHERRRAMAQARHGGAN